jgi:heptaprenyl diphosphate synthase
LTEAGELFGPVANDLASIEAALRDEIGSDPPEVAQPMAGLFAAGGKRLRPALVLLAGRCGRYDLTRLTPAAMAVELTHAATLVHDDVIDRSPTRRGRPTVAAALGNEPALVVGDFYFAKAYECAARTNSPEVVVVLADAVMGICVGEVRQQAIRYHYGNNVSEYMRLIEAKTALLLAASCHIGALLGGLDSAQTEALTQYGRSLGLAFQITDDVLDYTSTEGEIGKPIGHDIAEGFATLPLMLASVKVEGNQRLEADDARRIVDQVRASKGPEMALEQARHHADSARESLRALPTGEATSALAALADYVVSRKL